MRSFLLISLFFFGLFFQLANALYTFAPTQSIMPQQTPAVTPLNETTVAVTDQSAEALQVCLQAAFSDVMMKMSGNPRIMAMPEVQSASVNAMKWLQSYSYVQAQIAQPPEKPGLALHVVFNRDGLYELIKGTTKEAQTEVPPSVVPIFIVGVRDMADYTALMRALREKIGVAHVAVAGIAANRVALHVQITEDEAHFSEMLSQDTRFRPLSLTQHNLLAKNNEPYPLYYAWEGHVL